MRNGWAYADGWASWPPARGVLVPEGGDGMGFCGDTTRHDTTEQLEMRAIGGKVGGIGRVVRFFGEQPPSEELVGQVSHEGKPRV